LRDFGLQGLGMSIVCALSIQKIFGEYPMLRIDPPMLAESCEPCSDHRDCGWVREATERCHRHWGIPTDREDTEPVTMHELERWILPVQFGPKPPYPEIFLAHIGVMK
jgi:hypothetical protein